MKTRNHAMVTLLVLVLVLVGSLLSPGSALAANYDLQVTKTVSDTTPDEGQAVTYTVSVKNGGPAAVTGVVIQDILPAGVTFVSATATQGTYVSGTGLWTVGTLAGNATGTLTINVTVNFGTSGQTITNTASVYSVDQTDPS